MSHARRAPRPHREAPLPAPTMAERAQAAAAARALRAAIADPSTMGARAVVHADLARPRCGVWLTTWSNLPGFVRHLTTAAIKPGIAIGGAGTRYTHDLLPGWDYARAEVRAEMIPDLELLAERGVRPSVETAPCRERRPCR